MSIVLIYEAYAPSRNRSLQLAVTSIFGEVMGAPKKKKILILSLRRKPCCVLRPSSSSDSDNVEWMILISERKD
jgi:hypothetical protein